MYHVTDLPNGVLKHTTSGGIGYHNGGQLITSFFYLEGGRGRDKGYTIKIIKTVTILNLPQTYMYIVTCTVHYSIAKNRDNS